MRKIWAYQHVNLGPGEDYFQTLRINGELGWEAWHMEKDARGWRTIHFKMERPRGDGAKP
jgi:hypothetical protein